MLAVLLVLGSDQLLAHSQGVHHGCGEKLSKSCPNWKKQDKKDCMACAEAHLKEMEPDCTEARIKHKCSATPSPSPPTPPMPPMPPPPPTPPLKPHAGAPRPHIVMFVIDDQGWANVGYHNDLVKTPHMDTLAHEGATLDRHYVYHCCAPTRSSLMTGREPYHVLENINYVSRGMTLLPRKLQQVGYATHQVGKWHLGELQDWMTPVSRGFNTSLGYLTGDEDHYTQMQRSKGPFGCAAVDLWRDDGPAYGRNGTYGEYIYNAEIQRVIRAHDPSVPLFIYAALQSMHAPLEVPSKYSDLYPDHSDDFKIMNGMASISDEVLGNMTAELKARGMWNSTLIILTSDNGGPAGQASAGHSGNNFPLRGGKTNLFEGGVRVAAALGGGFLPESARGKTFDGYMHAADWYPTICGLAGIDAADPNPKAPEVPDIDGFDLWPYISGNESKSPRSEIMLSSENAGAIISGPYKLIMGVQSYGFWTSPNHPNASTDHRLSTVAQVAVDCGTGCLFNILEDPSEYTDLASTMPDKLAELQSLWQKRNSTKYWPPRLVPDSQKCEAYAKAHNGFLGPYLSWWPEQSFEVRRHRRRVCQTRLQRR